MESSTPQAPAGSPSGHGQRLDSINAALLSFGPDHRDNIRKITRLCGESFQASCALFNRLESGQLTAIAAYNPPADLKASDTPEGHICYDLIGKGTDEVVVMRDLQKSPYAKSDPLVRRYGFKTYIGRTVRIYGVHLGILCVVFDHDEEPDDEARHALSMLASLIGIEEERAQDYERLLRAESRLVSLLEHHEDAVCRWTPEMVLTYTNPSFNRLFTPEGISLVGRRWIDLISVEERMKSEEYYLQLFENPRVITLELRLPHPGGGSRLIRWTSIPVLSSSGRLIEVHSIGREISGSVPQ